MPACVARKIYFVGNADGAAKHTVIAEQPQVAGLRYRIFCYFGGGVIVGEAFVFLGIAVEQPFKVIKIRTYAAVAF